MLEFLAVKKAFAERTSVVVLTFRKGRPRAQGDFERKAMEDAMKIYRLLVHYLPNSTLLRLARIMGERHPGLLGNVHVPPAS